MPQLFSYVGGQTHCTLGHHRGTCSPAFFLTVCAMPEAMLGSVMLLPVTISLMFALALPSSAATRRLRVLWPVFYFVFVGLAPVGAVCPHCKDSIAGCTGGSSCPLVADLAANVAGMESGSLSTIPEVRHLVPPRLLSFTPAKDSYQIAISDRRYLSGAIWAKDSVLIAIAMLSDR